MSYNLQTDSGVEGISLGPAVINEMTNGQRGEVVEPSPNSLETLESGLFATF